ncbi:MAG TPA: hypothetical protein VF818_12670 [Ktedonobacterales bacterium]
MTDQFHFDWQTLSGDGAVFVHVGSQTNTDGWAKAGVMLRQTGAANAVFYAVYVTPTNGISVQYRSASGASAQQAIQISGAAPAYLEVGRAGSNFTAYTSLNSTSWTPIAGSTVALPNLSGALLAGLAVTSHNAGALSTVTFDTVGP